MAATTTLLDENGLFNWRAIQLLIGAAIGMLGGFVILFPFLLGVFLKPIGQDFEWSRAETSLLLTMSYLGMTVSAPFLAILLERFGPRQTMIVGYAILVFCLVLFAVLPGNLVFYGLTCLLAGLGASITTPGGLMLITAGSFDKKLGLALGCAMAGLGLGAAFMPIVAERAMDWVGWRGAYLCLAGLTVVLGSISMLLIFSVISPLATKRPKTLENQVTTELTYFDIITSWRFWIIGFALLATTIAATGSMAHIPAALTDRGMSPQEAAVAVGFIGLGIFVGRLGAAILMDLMFAPLVVLVCFLVGAVGFQLLLGASIEMEWLLFAGVVLIGLVTGTDGDVGPILSRRYFGPEAFTKVFGLLFGLWGLGAITGPLLAGLSYDITGDYVLVFNIATVLCIVSGLIVMCLGKYRFAPAK